MEDFKTFFDVIVVGASTSGAIAARLLLKFQIVAKPCTSKSLFTLNKWVEL